MVALKLRQIGNSVGVVLPREALARLKVDKGDIVYPTEAPDGFRLTSCDPESEEQADLGREIMKKRRTVLRHLAK